MTSAPVTLRLFLGVLALVSISACDSGDGGDPPSPADVDGVYDFAELRFVPRPTALDPIDVTDTVVGEDTFVELFDGGQATLRFRRTGGTVRLIPGDIEVLRDQIRLTFAASEDNGAALEGILLPQVLTFDRDDDDALTATLERTVDLQAYDADRYSGFRSVRGTLTVRLTPRDS